jgi:hypothetical protein
MIDSELNSLKAMIARAEKLVAELGAAYDHDLQAQNVSLEALNITHEIVEKCSNVLDQAMTLFFNRKIAPLLVKLPKRGGYFPVARNEDSYRSTMGVWNASDLQTLSPELDAKLRSLQPFSAEENVIYARIRELANKKHTSLVPQVRQEQSRVSVARAGSGGVSWGPGVTFGGGVSVMGAPIEPQTQMPAHNHGIDVSKEIWVNFLFKEGGENALAFCRQAPLATDRVLDVLFG